MKTEFFNDYAKALDAMHCLGATIIQEGSIVSSLSVLRPEKSGPFEDAEAKLMHALMPHLQRALRMHHRLTSLEVRNQANAEILDRLPAGVLLLGPDGLVLFVNRAAQAIIESRDGLTIERTGLAGATPRETSRLRTVIARASASARGAWDDSGGAVRLPRPSGRRDLALVVTPLAAGNRLNPGIAGATVAAFVSDPEHSPVANEDHLRRLYGLTRAESALAARLASGLTLQEASEHLAVSKNTVRWHLKSVFAKTATRNQSDLMRLILSGPGTLPPT
jgi:DNA-binding CsgD family transcriptional regulator